MSKCKVFYRSKDGGVVAFCGQKAIFHHNHFEPVDLGLGEVKDILLDKGNYAFAQLMNRYSCIPTNYFKLDFFVNIGVPMKVQKGVYGGAVFLKETYRKKVVIRAYDRAGNVLLYESKYKIKGSERLVNIHYVRLDKTIIDWVDLSDELDSKLQLDLLTKQAKIDVTADSYKKVLRRLKNNKVWLLPNGLITVDGTHDSLIIFGSGADLSFVWYNKLLTFEGATLITKNTNIEL